MLVGGVQSNDFWSPKEFLFAKFGWNILKINKKWLNRSIWDIEKYQRVMLSYLQAYSKIF